MAEGGDSSPHQETEVEAAPPAPAPDVKLETARPALPSLTIWPPSQRTRDAVAQRLVETLSSPSVLSKRYGAIPHDEARAAADRIEEDAFVVASSSAPAPAPADAAAASIDDGIETLQVYSKEISRRMLEFVKSSAADKAPAEGSLKAVEITPSEEPAGPAAPATSEEISSLESETSAA